MKAKIKKVLLVLAGCVATLVLAVVIFTLTFNLNPYRPRIEAAASRATGMQVRINGKMRLMFIPHAGVSVKDVLIHNRGEEIVSLKKAEVRIRLLPFLRRKALIQRIWLITPTFFITKGKNGRFNYEAPEKPAGEEPPPQPFEAESIFIERGRLLYLDETSGERAEFNECGLHIENFHTGGGELPGGLSFEGDLSCKEAKADQLRISDIRVAVKSHNGKFEANPVTMNIFGGNCKGSVKRVMTGGSPVYSVDFAITKMHFEEMLGAFRENKSIRGNVELKSHVVMQGKNANEMRSTADGEISLRGQDLFHEGVDLDHMLAKYEKSQNFNLIDIGSYFVAGPLGPLLTKGYDMGRFYVASMAGKSVIRELVSDWKIKNGVAETKDVAFTTNKNRVALKGRLDLVHERFDNMTVASLDEKGCVRFGQKIFGPFRSPRFAKISALRSVVGPVFNLLEDTQRLLKGGDCEKFYTGSVKHPHQESSPIDSLF